MIFPEGLGVGDAGAGIEDPDRLIRRIVVDDHLLGADDRSAPKLAGCKPRELDVRHRPGGVAEVDEGDVGNIRQHTAAADRGDLGGQIVEPVTQDREVVRAEIPDDAHVRLMQAQVHPARRDEVDLTERLGIDEPLDRGHRRAVEKGVTGHEDEAVGLRQRGHLDDLVGRGSERLLDEDVLSRLECRHREGIVRRHRRRDRDRVNRRVTQNLFIARRAGDGRIAVRHRLQRLRSKIAEIADLESVRLGEVPEQIRAPVTETDDADANAVAAAPARRIGLALWHQPVSRFRKITSGVRKSRRRSRPKDQPRAYATSRSSASPKVECARASTCHRPVSPAGTRKRSN